MLGIVAIVPNVGRPSRHCWRRRLSGADVAGVKFRGSVWTVRFVAGKLAARRHDVEKINTASGRNTAAEERHQRRDQLVRTSGGENHLSTGIIGFVAGLIAKFLHPGDNEPSGFIVTTLLGIAGAFVATYLGQLMGLYRPDEGAGLIGAVVGAIVVLVIWGAFARRPDVTSMGPR